MSHKRLLLHLQIVSYYLSSALLYSLLSLNCVAGPVNLVDRGSSIVELGSLQDLVRFLGLARSFISCLLLVKG